MLAAHYYPKFKKYENFAGNYGNAWWKQKEEFEAFAGPVLMTTNCIVPPGDGYKDRLWTTPSRTPSAKRTMTAATSCCLRNPASLITRTTAKPP